MNQYMRFGQGGSVGHYGGRYIWQLEDHRNLVICWKVVKGAREEEKRLIREFQWAYRALPLANLVR